jgi:hypothetical protein
MILLPCGVPFAFVPPGAVLPTNAMRELGDNDATGKHPGTPHMV